MNIVLGKKEYTTLEEAVYRVEELEHLLAERQFREISVCGLTTTEFAIARAISKLPVFSEDALMILLYSGNHGHASRPIKTHMSNLRCKLVPYEVYIETVKSKDCREGTIYAMDALSKNNFESAIQKRMRKLYG